MFEKLSILVNGRINKIIGIILLLIAGFSFSHLIPQSRWEKENSAALIRQYTEYQLQVGGKNIMILSSDTTDFKAAWINKWVMLPSCHGCLVSFFHETQPAAYTHLKNSKFITQLKDQFNNQLDSLSSEEDELHYYLRVHDVEDEGFGAISAFSNHLDSVIAKLKHDINILDSIKDNTTINIHAYRKYTAIYIDSHAKIKEEPCNIVRYSHLDKYQIFQIESEKTPNSVDILNHQKSLKDIPDYVYTRKYGSEGKKALLHEYPIIFNHHWNNGWKLTAGQWIFWKNYDIQGKWNCDTLYYGIRKDSLGTYVGEMNRNAIAQGWGKYFAPHRSYYEGTWKNNRREGFGYSIKPHHKIRAGEWKNDRYYGERVNYTSNRIYGIDISKYQHLAGRRLVSINWKQVKIIGLGQLSRKKITGTINYKISFAYIKSTEGRSLYNTFYHTDYTHAKAAGIKVGTYHYFSTTSSASQQAYFFLKHSIFHYGDFPPVLDVEPLPSQIKKMGGISELFNRIRTWLYIVERKTGTRPILYISQIFVNRYLPAAPDIRHNYQIWIARYGEYKPDVRLAYWQLSPDGRVKGIHGIVDINVFNGYHGEFEDFIHSYCIK